VEERERENITPKQAEAHEGVLTSGMVDRLVDLALMSETHTRLSRALGESCEMLTSLVERHPEFRGASGQLLAKLDELQRLQATLGTEVMKYSHHCEDAMVAAP